MAIRDPKREIIKQLEYVASNGQRPSEIYSDFLEMTHATLVALPAMVKASVTKQLFEDTPDTDKLFKRLHEKYKSAYWVYFQKAFSILIESTDEFQDTLGEVYMEFGFPNKGTGQFFTPYPISQLMAKIICGDIEAQVHERIKEACKGNSLAEAMLFTSFLLKDADQADEWFFEKLIPLVGPDVKPITVCDCCCGSGAMLLAAAECCPPWALYFGFVQFYGQDIDQRCVMMAQTNMMLYGLNGYGIKCVLGLSGAELERIPTPWREKYEEAQAADQAGDQERIQKINEELKSWKQASLF